MRATATANLVGPPPAAAARPRHAGTTPLRLLPARPSRTAARPVVALALPASVCLTTGAAAGAALLSGLSMDTKDLKAAVVAAAGLAVAAQLAPFLAQAALGAAPALEPSVLFAAAAKGVLLPLLGGLAVKAALPGPVAGMAPLLPLAAWALFSLVCGSVVAGSAEAARAGGLRLVGAVAAAQAGTAALLFASSKAGLPVQGGAVPAGALVGAAGAVLASTLAPAQPLVAMACIGSALVSAVAALLSGASRPAMAGAAAEAGAQSDGAQYLREVLKIPLEPKPSAPYSWQLPADTYLTVLRSRDESDATVAPASTPADVPANVAEARAWIAAWRAKQGRA